MGRISGHMAESLYGGWGISLVRIASFVSRISRSAQVTAISHFLFKPLKHRTLRGLEPPPGFDAVARLTSGGT